MSIYEQRLNRSIPKNLATLRDLQAERKHNYEKDRDRPEKSSPQGTAISTA